MLALLASLAVGLYILVPDLLFRRISSLFTPLKKFQRTKTEELVFGILVAAIPVLLAYALSVSIWFIGNHPFPLDETQESKTSDYKTVFLATISESYFRAHEAEVWQAADHVRLRQLRFLTWTYTLLTLEVFLWSVLTYNYGKFKTFAPYNWFANKVLLKRISEWHVLLTTYNFPKHEKRFVLVDALVGDNLYQGRVANYFVNVDGTLSGILLKETKRYKFAQHEEDRKANHINISDPEYYWTKIPGSNLYLPYANISNLNIHYRLSREDEQKRLENKAQQLTTIKELLKKLGKNKITIQAP